MNPPKELLFTYFASQATSVQQNVIGEWLTQPGSREVYFQWLDEWERQYPQYTPDVTHHLHQFSQRLDAGVDVRPQPVRVDAGELRPLWRPGRWLAAASITVVLLAGGWLFREPLLYRTLATGPQQLRALTLPDGSTVALNSSSTLRLPRVGYGWFSRRVRLTGDAVFDVKHLATHQPFTVETANGLTVDVLGTEFSVRTRATRAEVVLRRGRVSLQFAPDNRPAQNLLLKPGDRATLDGRGALTLQSRSDTTKFAHWRYRLFSFNDTPLRDVVYQMHTVFGVTVQLSDPALARRRLTGTIRAGSSDELADALAELLDLRVTYRGQQLIFFTVSPNLPAQ